MLNDLFGQLTDAHESGQPPGSATREVAGAEVQLRMGKMVGESERLDSLRCLPLHNQSPSGESGASRRHDRIPFVHIARRPTAGDVPIPGGLPVPLMDNLKRRTIRHGHAKGRPRVSGLPPGNLSNV